MRARVERNFVLIEVKLDGHDKLCQHVVERRIKTPQVTRQDEAPSQDREVAGENRVRH